MILTFENAGPTIPPEKLQRMFEQFFRLDPSRGTRSGNAGLGPPSPRRSSRPTAAPSPPGAAMSACSSPSGCRSPRRKKIVRISTQNRKPAERNSHTSFAPIWYDSFVPDGRFLYPRGLFMQSILVIFGGVSSEYAVSLQSAQAVLAHLDRSRFAPLMAGITRAGRWLRYTGPVEEIGPDRWQDGPCVPCTLRLDREARQLLLWTAAEQSCPLTRPSR